MLLFAEYARNPTIVVTLRTSQPSFSIITETMALAGLSKLSIEFACSRSLSS
jgi:hypothetical protein